jgi:hypothetical protein
MIPAISPVLVCYGSSGGLQRATDAFSAHAASKRETPGSALPLTTILCRHRTNDWSLLRISHVSSPLEDLGRSWMFDIAQLQ